MKENGKMQTCLLVRRWTQGHCVFQVVLVVKNPPANAGDAGVIPGSGRSPGGGHSNLLQYSCPENPMDKRSLAGHSPQGHNRVGHD